MSNQLEYIFSLIKERKAEIPTLFIGFILLLGGIFIADIFLTKYVGKEGVRVALYLLSVLAWISYWLYIRFSLPRNEKGKIGVVVAIYAENEKEREILKNDFLVKLRSEFRQEGKFRFSKIIFLENHFAKEIDDAEDQKKKIDKFNKKIKAHFYIYGKTRKRPDAASGEKYVVEFLPYVVHAPTSDVFRSGLAKDMNKLFPKEVSFLASERFDKLEYYASKTNIAIWYLIGYASFISQDPFFAFELHQKLKEKIDSIPNTSSEEDYIKERLAHFIPSELIWMANWEYYHGNKTIEEIKARIDKALEYKPHLYDAWILKALISFKEDGDIDEAIRCTAEAERYSNGTYEWRYNQAFFYFWKGNYKGALRMCKTIRHC